jgi:ActR/RegA family two-component response regulator
MCRIYLWEKRFPVKEQEKCKVLVAGFPETPSQEFENDVSLASHPVIRTYSGKETIEKCLTDPGICYLLMDVNLSGLNGFEVSQYLRKAGYSDLFIILVGWFSVASAEMALTAGCNEFIAKPLNLNVIAGVLSENKIGI